jgi:hypothetical protein
MGCPPARNLPRIGRLRNAEKIHKVATNQNPTTASSVLHLAKGIF